MSIRSNALPVGRDLSPELRDILRRNGMQAHIIRHKFSNAIRGSRELATFLPGKSYSRHKHTRPD